VAVELDIEAKGLDELRDLLKKGVTKLGDLRPVLKVTAEQLKSLTDESFATSTSPDGTPFAPLAESTLKQKLKKGYSAKPLIRRGARGLKGATHATAKKDRILVGVAPTAPHGAYHQQGKGVSSGAYGVGIAGRGHNLPRRAFLPFTRSGALMPGPKIKAITDDMERRLRLYLFGE